VLATDIDVSWLHDADAGVDVRRHDVATDEPPGDAFDLVHARLVLVHVAARDEALRRMISALGPGGWLVVEDFDTAPRSRRVPRSDHCRPGAGEPDPAGVLPPLGGARGRP
jgi:SAM-dependent methyltransferase